MAIDPASELRAPTVDNSWAKANNITGFSQYLSPSFLLGEAAQWILGQNPWDEASKMVAGDWESVAKTAEAIKNLANFNAAYVSALSEQTGGLFPEHWRGRAATAAGSYFANLAQALRDQVQPLRDMGDQVTKLAYGVFQMADTIKGLLEMLTDALISAGLGTVLSAGVKAPALIQRVKGIWDEILDAYNKGIARARYVVALILGYGTDIQRLPINSLSPAGYNYPGVRPVGPSWYTSGVVD
jgi:hypothetical protein